MNLLEFIGTGTVLFFLYIIYISFREKKEEKIAENEKDIGLLLTYHTHFNKMFKDFKDREETKYKERRAKIRKRIDQEKKDNIYEFDEREYNYINHRGFDLYDKIVWTDNYLVVKNFKEEIKVEIAKLNRDKEQREMMKAILAKVKSPEFRN